MKSILEQLQDNKITYDPTNFNLAKELEEVFKNYKPQKPIYEYAAHDYPSLSDNEFKLLCTLGNASWCEVRFIGGLEGVTKMRARCERLGIKIN